MPEAARTQDAAGAEAFVRYYFDLLNRSLVDLDTQYLRQFADGCEDCERIARETEQDAQSGYHYSGGELHIVGDIHISLSGPNQAESAFVADQEALTVLDSAGNPVPTLVFEKKDDLSSGALAAWDTRTSSWRLNVLTLG
jgi:hypothetical protein